MPEDPLAARRGPPGDPDLWVAVGIVGVVLFLVGVYQPALARFPYPGALQTVVAVGGAATAVLGFTYAQRARAARPKPVPSLAADRVLRLGPSVEVYDPRAFPDRPRAADVSPDEVVEPAKP